MAKKKSSTPSAATCPTDDLKKSREAIWQSSRVSLSEGYFDQDQPDNDHEFDAEFHPPIPQVLMHEVVAVLLHWPTTWVNPDLERCSGLRREALELLIQRGLLEARLHGKDAIGRGVVVIVSGPVSDQMLAETFATNTITANKSSPSEVRLSAEGHKARSVLKGGEAIGDVGEVVGFVFWDKLNDGLFGKVKPVVQVESAL